MRPLGSKQAKREAFELVECVREHLDGGAGYEKTESMVVNGHCAHLINEAAALVDVMMAHETREHERTMIGLVEAYEVLSHAVMKVKS